VLADVISVVAEAVERDSCKIIVEISDSVSDDIEVVVVVVDSVVTSPVVVVVSDSRTVILESLVGSVLVVSRCLLYILVSCL